MNKRKVSFFRGLLEDGVLAMRVTVEMQSASRDYHIFGKPGTVEVQSIWFAGQTREELNGWVTCGLKDILLLLSDQNFFLHDPDGVIQGTPYFHPSVLLERAADGVRSMWTGVTETQHLVNSLWSIYGDTTEMNVLLLIEGAKHYGREVEFLSGETK